MYFVDRKRITDTLAYMDKLIGMAEEKKDWQGMLEELALERLAQNTIEAIIDVGNSMIDGFIMRDPGSYEDILDILLDEKVIDTGMHQPLIQVIQLRKMLVRNFTSADHQQILETFRQSLPALKAFSPRVQDYLINELGPVSAFMPETNE